MKSKLQLVLFTFALLAIAMPARPSVLKGLRKKPEHVVKTFRIIARVPNDKLTTLGLNHESYIVEVNHRAGDESPQYIKVSYRFHQREPRMPVSLLDYSLVHKFRMTRDESCDETWKTLSTRYLFDSDGTFRGVQDDVVYAQNAPRPQFDLQTVLPCYTVSPQDYQSTSKNHPATDRNNVAQGK